MATGSKPFVFETKSSRGEEKDVVVLHHVLRVMQMRGGEQQCKNAGERMVDCEFELAEKSEAHQRRENSDENVCGEADEDIADRRIGIFVVRKEGKVFDDGADHVLGQHEQRLADAIPALQASAAAVHTEFGELPAVDRRFRCPEGVGGVEAVLRVCRAQFAGLDDESDEACGKGEQENGVAEKGMEAVILPHVFRVSRRGGLSFGRAHKERRARPMQPG